MKRKLSARGLPLAVDGGALVALKSGISLVFHKAPLEKRFLAIWRFFPKPTSGSSRENKYGVLYTCCPKVFSKET